MERTSFEGHSSEGSSQGGTQAGLVQISRRRFLQVAGASTALGAAACASPADQKILPYVNPDAEVIPGVAVWYSSTCTECSAGCGIRVRTREGRAVKVEGNPESPVNRGGLCALGQSSLQALYNPDRIRQPMRRKATAPEGVEFEPCTWDEAYLAIANALTRATNKKVILTGDLPTSHLDLVEEWTQKLGFSHLVWDAHQPVAVAKAAEMVFGTYGVPTYHLAKADAVINFGADFLETWVNPVGFAREWADSRRSAHPLRLVHIEPRLSLTGANADMWLKANPGSEVRIAIAILAELMKRGTGDGLSSDLRGKIQQLTRGVTLEGVEEQTGVLKAKLLLVVEYLASANAPLVIGGGAATATADPLPLLVAINLINLVLGSVGKTVELVTVPTARSSATALAGLVADMAADKVDVLFTYGTNPQYSFPEAFGYEYGVKRVSLKDPSKGKPAGLVVALASQMDETAQLADFILPVNTPLEDWGYKQVDPQSVSLMQPSMSRIFNTYGFGDVLLTVGIEMDRKVDGFESFDAYVKARYQKLVKTLGVSGDTQSDDFWRESLERGGVFSKARGGAASPRGAVSPAVFTLSYGVSTPKVNAGELLLYPYPSVKAFDGRAANRPWMQELADPITQAVWGAWAELHPETAKGLKVQQGDQLILRTDQGEAHLPVYVSEHVHEGIVAMPLGQGHASFGRYANTTGIANAYALLPKVIATGVDAIPTTGVRVTAKRGLGDGELVTVQDFSSQTGRELARTTFITAGAHAHAEGAHGAHGGHHEAPKQMYEQREHPLYKWGMTVDLAACTGCSACVVACSAENNIPVVGKKIVAQGREMAWIRIERYHDKVKTEDGGEELKVSFLPMMCQHCQNAPCEPVCPVYATYHNEEGVNAMVYNRCVGTRYCSNNCSYKVRRFNWFQYEWPELLDWQVNPDVTKRTVGVMEKCTFCVQRIAEGKDIAKDLGRMVADGEITPACVQTCPTQALTFGNLNDPNSKVSKSAHHERAYKVLDHHLNTQPSVSYLEDIRYKA